MWCAMKPFAAPNTTGRPSPAPPRGVPLRRGDTYVILLETRASAATTSSCADPGFHLHRVLLAVWISVPSARGLARPMRAALSAAPTRGENPVLPAARRP